MHNPITSYKTCPQCYEPAPLEASRCMKCGHAFRTNFNQPPPVNPPGVNPTMAFQAQQQPGHDRLAEMARRYKSANTAFIWTLIGGIFCLWPLWIVTYLEWRKMQDIKDDVGRMGVDVYWWQSTYGAK